MREGWEPDPRRPLADTTRAFGPIRADAFEAGTVQQRGFRFEVWRDGKMRHSATEMLETMDAAQIAAEAWLRDYARREAELWTGVVAALGDGGVAEFGGAMMEWPGDTRSDREQPAKGE